MGAFFFFTGLLSFAGHALFYAWARRTVPVVARHPRIAGALIALLALGAPLARLFARWATPFFTIEALALLIGGLLSLLVTSVLRGGLAVVDGVRGMREPRADDPPSPPSNTRTPSVAPALAPAAPVATPIGRRVLLERTVGAATYGAVGSVLGWGVVRGRHDYRVEEVVVRVPGLSPKLDGYTIAQVSDLHAGELVDAAEFDRGFAFLRAFKPDLVVATGDLVDHEASHAPMLARKLAELGARDGTIAILGNHDYYAGSDLVERAMTAAGVRMLINDTCHLQADSGSGLVIVGMDDYAGHRRGRGPDLGGTLRRLAPEHRQAPRILLAHQPPFFDDLFGQAVLQLSGHTHGGQINFGVQSAKLVGMRYVAGRYEGGKNTSLWVNRGFGVAGPPARVAAPPEITKIVLVAA